LVSIGTTDENGKHELNHTNNKRQKTTNNIDISTVSAVFDENVVPECFIICEKQEALFCGRHALRALVQNLDIFDDSYLMNLAEQISMEELLIKEDVSTCKEFYFNPTNGYYHIQVIERALKQLFNIQLINLKTGDQASNFFANLIMDNIRDIQALFIYKKEHYFCVRRFDSSLDYFFIIDSLSYKKHRIIQRSRIHDYIDYLHQCDALIYVPVCADILQMETISSDSLISLIHALPICEADKIHFSVNQSRNFLFD
jgi:hypothetical protein